MAALIENLFISLFLALPCLMSCPQKWSMLNCHWWQWPLSWFYQTQNGLFFKENRSHSVDNEVMHCQFAQDCVFLLSHGTGYWFGADVASVSNVSHDRELFTLDTFKDYNTIVLLCWIISVIVEWLWYFNDEFLLPLNVCKLDENYAPCPNTNKSLVALCLKTQNDRNSFFLFFFFERDGS